MMKHQILILFLFFPLQLMANENKIEQQLALDLKSKATVEVYLLLKNKQKIKAESAQNPLEKLNSHIKQLKANSQFSKNVLQAQLQKTNGHYKFYWINNSLWARLPTTEAKKLIANDAVAYAYSNQKQHLAEIKPSKQSNASKNPQAVIWNIAKINAPQAWAQGYSGQNVLIAGQDTGYKWNHPALKNKYAGFDGTSVNHNYHWHDAITNPNVICGSNSQPESCDDHGHGTHTMGTMLGDDGAGNQIGVAPDAKWIGCRNMNQGVGTPATYTECFQFFMQPTDLTGNNPDASKAPDIINNSWGCDASEGCFSPNVLQSVVNNVVDAGILVVAAAGNSGPGCNTVSNPIAIYAKSLTVGASTQSDAISVFSSQGGVTVDVSNRLKPDLVAPGSAISSASLFGGYVNMDGTSMAAPHVAGVAALMLSANSAMKGKPKIIKQVLLRTAQHLTSQQTCSQLPGAQIPNNTFGWGRVDALAAVNQIKDIIFLDNFSDF